MKTSTLYTPRSTFNCAFGMPKSPGLHCIPCLHKLFPSGKAIFSQPTDEDSLTPRSQVEWLLPPNQRPECCPRAKSTSYGGLYQVGQNILTVGDGDLSFSSSLVNYFSSCRDLPQTCASTITATTHETYESICSIYTGADISVENLKSKGATVMHSIDATRLQDFPAISNQKYDIILWNFPCIRIEKGADGQVSELELNKELLRKFFNCAKDLLTIGGEVHVTHKTIEPFSWWNIEELAYLQGFSCLKRVIFDRCNYPGYVNRKVLDKKSFPCNDAQTFIFVLDKNDHEPLHPKKNLRKMSDRKISEALCMLQISIKDRIIPKKREFGAFQTSSSMKKQKKMT